MKKSFFLLFFLLSTSLLFAQTEDKKGRVEVTFHRKLQFNDLVKIKIDMADKGISVYYDRLVFDESGGLSEISFRVDCHDGFKGSAHSGQVYNQSKTGFFRDYDDKSYPFGTQAD
jgi:hypothetical protein